MLTDNRADYRPQDWYLIACDGDLVLKLAHDLLIGEDERGQIVLSPARADALLGITSETGRLTLQALAMEWTFSENGGLSLQHLTFDQDLSLRLVFPNSTLVITPDFRAGTRVSVDREIEFKPTVTPRVTLSRVDEPVTVIDPPDEALNSGRRLQPEAQPNVPGEDISIEEVSALLEAANETDADEVFLRWDHDVPDEVIPEHLVRAEGDEIPLLTETIREISPLAEPVAEPAVVSPDGVTTGNADSQTKAQVHQLPNATIQPVSRHRALAGLIAAMALLAPMYFFMSDGEDVGVDFPLSNYHGDADTTAAAELPVENVPVVTLPASDLPADTGPAEKTEGVLLTEEMTPPAPVDLAEQDRLLIQSLLAEAKAFYDAGAIVTPVQSNAVSNLTQVLHMDPTNEEGLRLMYLSAVRLIDEAEVAHEAGDHYLARNLVEDVLGFHPEFRDARNLLESWTRTPDS